ncbi:MAG: hypothetical protein RQ754_15895 [Desulfuromonadales bacterium]|nr:hypothetical protein [Desulfuromonadales bacterium]
MQLQPASTRYLETTGEEQKIFQLTLHATTPLTLTYQNDKESGLTTFGPDLATRHWQLESADHQTRIAAVRRNETLSIEGTLSGEPIMRTLDLGDLPWYQALSVSLRAIIEHPQGPREFWILRPDTLDLHHMQVSELIARTLELEGQVIPTWRLTIRLTGWQSYLWHAHYWLRQTDGRFVKYEGVSGPPGTPATVITLSSEEFAATQETH